MKMGWQIQKLGEVATLQRGFDLPEQDRVSGNIPLVSSSGISDTHNKSAARGPGVVTGRSGSIGNVFYIKDDFWPLNTVLYVKDFHGNNRRFVYYLLKEFDLKRFASGAGVPTLNRNLVHNELVNVPSLPEQQRIVDILDEAFEGIDTAKTNAKKNFQNAHALFEGHLQSVFATREKGWVDRQLASLCQEITVGHVGPMKTQYRERGVPFLRSQNIHPFELSMENVTFIDDAFHRALKKSHLRPGDLVIVRTGYPGTAAVIPPELPDSNCSDLVIVRPSKEVSPYFLAAFFNSAFGKQLVLGKIVGAAQKHFNIGAAKEVMLHVPPMPEQLTIVAKSETLRYETRGLARVYEQKLTALEALKNSLLHQAFNGSL